MKSEYKKQLLEESLERIMHVREMIESFGAITSYLSNHGRESINQGDILSMLYERELNEWRGLFMWGLVADEKTRDRVKAAAHERFLSDRMHVAHWMFNGENPSSWLVKDEEEFRAATKEMFAPKSKE